MGCLRVTVAILAATGVVSAQGNMYGTGSSSWGTAGGGGSSYSSSSSSSSSGGGGSVSNSAISQSQPGGRVEMRCGGSGDMVWYRQDGRGRRELGRNGRLTSAPSRYGLDSSFGQSVLTISPTETSDTGLFICETRTGSGLTSTHTYKLTIGSGGGGGGGNGAYGRSAGAAAGFMGAMMLFL